LSPWYWISIGLVVLAVAWAGWTAYDIGEIGFTPAVLIVVAVIWVGCVWYHDEPASWKTPTPVPTRECVVQQLEPVYSQPLKHTVPTWVCTGWSEQ
jgi:hypothetical protein